jgi:hypothetical protein
MLSSQVVILFICVRRDVGKSFQFVFDTRYNTIKSSALAYDVIFSIRISHEVNECRLLSFISVTT